MSLRSCLKLGDDGLGRAPDAGDVVLRRQQFQTGTERHGRRERPEDHERHQRHEQQRDDLRSDRPASRRLREKPRLVSRRLREKPRLISASHQTSSRGFEHLNDGRQECIWRHPRTRMRRNCFVRSRAVDAESVTVSENRAAHGDGGERVAHSPTLLIVDGANVVGSVPDGWWRDRRGAAVRLRDRLRPMAADGLPAEPGSDCGHRSRLSWSWRALPGVSRPSPRCGSSRRQPPATT